MKTVHYRKIIDGFREFLREENYADADTVILYDTVDDFVKMTMCIHHKGREFVRFNVSDNVSKDERGIDTVAKHGFYLCVYRIGQCSEYFYFKDIYSMVEFHKIIMTEQVLCAAAFMIEAEAVYRVELNYKLCE